VAPQGRDGLRDLERRAGHAARELRLAIQAVSARE
jgi:hypothetical protein